MQSVPFENLDFYLGKPIDLAPASLYKKIVEAHRGGICYELNALFYQLLVKIGFEVKLIAAEVYEPDGTLGPPFDHMALVVKVAQEDYLVDVGFGDITLPLRLSDANPQGNARGHYRMVQDGDRYTVMWVSENQAQRPMFRFFTTPCRVSDFNAMCVYHQTSEHSRFTKKEICSRATASGRITISGNELIESTGDTRTVIALATAEDKQQARYQHFGIRL